jgi:hypothetical protein
MAEPDIVSIAPPVDTLNVPVARFKVDLNRPGKHIDPSTGIWPASEHAPRFHPLAFAEIWR